MISKTSIGGLFYWRDYGLSFIFFYSAGVYSAGAFVFGYAWNKSRSLSRRQKGVEQGTRILLKMNLIRIHRASSKQGCITYDDAALAEEIYDAYHALGGNGSGTHMLADIKKMRMLGNDGKV